MRLEAFRRRAGRMWDEIPEVLKEGVEALSVEGRAEPHPNLEGIYTLGECVTEDWPSQYGGPGDLRSDLVLYHGSFRALADTDPTFDWEGELWETILHELLHHREYAAGQSGLDEFDWAVENNQRRYAGEPFDPDFYRAVPPGPDGTHRLESEIFIEAEASPDAGEARFEWRGTEYGVRIPAGERPAFVKVRNLARGRLWLVVRAPRPWWRRLLPAREGDPVQVERRALPAPAA